jgi:hypothetical protein
MLTGKPKTEISQDLHPQESLRGLASGFWQGWLSAVIDSHGCFVACDFWLSSSDAFILFGTAFTGIFALAFTSCSSGAL